MTGQHVLVVGPGLGRDDHMQDCARIAFELARELDQMSLVVDADGLWLIQVGQTRGGNADGDEGSRVCKTGVMRY